MRLEHEKFERHALSFAVGMVSPQNAETKPYEAMLCKFGSFLETLEVRTVPR